VWLLLERLELCLQIRDLMTELRDLATLVHEFGGNVSQGEAEPLGLDFRPCSRQVRLVRGWHGGRRPAG